MEQHVRVWWISKMWAYSQAAEGALNKSLLLLLTQEPGKGWGKVSRVKVLSLSQSVGKCLQGTLIRSVLGKAA